MSSGRGAFAYPTDEDSLGDSPAEPASPQRCYDNEFAPGEMRRSPPLAFHRLGAPRLAQARRGKNPPLGAGLRQLVVALEPTQFFHHSRRLAAAIARSTDLSVELVCIVDGFQQIFAAKNPALLADPQGYLDRIGAVVETLVALTRGEGVACVGKVLVGHPALELTRHLHRTDADLLLLGGHIPGAAPRLQALHWRPLSIERRWR